MRLGKHQDKPGREVSKMRYLRYLLQIVIAALFCLFNSGDQLAVEVSHPFVQTDWQDGVSATTASHPTDKTGWKKYSAKDAYIATVQGANIALSPESFTITDTTDTDFVKGTVDKVVVVKPAKVVGTDNKDYKCIKGHTSNTANDKPITGTNWATYWTDALTTGQGETWVNNTRYLMPIGPPEGDPVTGVDAELQVTSFVADPFAKILGEWLTLPSIPSPGNFTSYVEAGNFIYVLFASGDGKQFGKFDVTTEKWTMLAPLPKPAAAGSAIAWDGEAIFAVRGEDSVETYKYTPGTNTWAAYKDLSSGANYGAAMVHVGGTIASGTGKLYILLGGVSRSFACSDPAVLGGAWLNKADAPATVEHGGQLVYPGAGNYLYACRGQYTGTFWRYRINETSQGAHDGDTWFADVPALPDAAEDTNSGTNGGLMHLGSRLWCPGQEADGNYYAYVAMPYNVFNRDDVRNWQTFWRLPISDPPPEGWQWQRLADCPDYTDELSFIIYASKHIVVGSDGNDYRCILSHTAADANKPISGANWTTYWVSNSTTGKGTVWAGGESYSPGQKIHLLSGKNLSKPWEYDVTSNKWREVTQNIMWSNCNNHDFCYVKNTAGYEDYIYWLYDVYFWRYKISTNSWERLANAPYRNCRDRALTDVGGYMYLLRGESTLNWARYNLSQTVGSDLWATLPDFPEHPQQSDTVDRRMHNGAGIVGVVSSALAARTQDVVVGSSDGLDYKCIKSHWAATSNRPTSGASWSTYWQATGGSGTGAAWTSANNKAYSDFTGTSGHNNFIYAWRGQDMDYFYRIDVAGNPTSWTFSRATNLPWGSLCGGYMVSQGGNIYAMYGHNSYEFRKYQILEDVWGTSNLNGPLEGLYESGGSCSAPLANDGTSRYLYYINTRCCEYYAYRWQRFDTQTGLWDELPELPFFLSRGARVVVTPNLILMYHRYAEDLFNIYDIAAGKWRTPVTSQSFATTPTGSLVKDGNNNIYLMFGNRQNEPAVNNFWIYTPSVGRWTGILTAPFTVGAGTKSIYLANRNSIYVLEGKGSKNLWRYNLTTGVWSKCSASTKRIWRGSEIAGGDSITLPSVGVQDAFFVLGGMADTGFSVYISDESGAGNWMGRASAPDAHETRGTDTMTYNKNNNKIYKLRAEATADFYEYSVAEDTWVPLTAEPVGTGGSAGKIYTCDEGAALYYPGSGTKIYCYTGQSNDLFLNYDIGTRKWSELYTPPTETGAEQTAMISVGDGYIYVYDNIPYNYLYRYHISANKFDVPSFLPVALASGGAICGYKGNIYYVAGGTGYLYRFNIVANQWNDLTLAPSTFPYEDPALEEVEYKGAVYIFATEGRDRQEFMRYNVALDSWDKSERMSGMCAAP